jgi:hypothetical protein
MEKNSEDKNSELKAEELSPPFKGEAISIMAIFKFVL